MGIHTEPEPSVIWSTYFCENLSLLELKQGKYQKTKSLVDDEDIREACLAFSRSQKADRIDSQCDFAGECAADDEGAKLQFRGDIRVRGGTAPDGIEGVVDVGFTTPTGRNNAATMSRVTRGENESVTSWTKRQVNRVLAAREAAKVQKYRSAFTCAFTPVIFSTGGYAGLNGKTWLDRLGVFDAGKSALVFDLSVELVRARTTSL
jgi:hypothetical protein